MTPVDDIINNLESLLTLFKEYGKLNSDFRVPMKCFKKLTKKKMNDMKKVIDLLE